MIRLVDFSKWTSDLIDFSTQKVTNVMKIVPQNEVVCFDLKIMIQNIKSFAEKQPTLFSSMPESQKSYLFTNITKFSEDQSLSQDLRSVVRSILDQEPVTKKRRIETSGSGVLRAAIELIPKAERTDLTSNAISLVFDGIVSKHEYDHILFVLGNIQEDQRSSVIKLSADFLKTIESGHDRAGVLQSINLMSEDDRAAIFEKTEPFLLSMSDKSSSADILRVVTLIPPSQRTDEIIQELCGLFQVNTVFVRMCVCSALSLVDLKDKQISLIIQTITSVVVAFDSVNKADDLIDLFKSSPGVLEFFKIVLNGSNNLEYSQVQAVSEFFLFADKDKVLDKNGESAMVRLCRVLEEIPLDQRLDVIVNAKDLLKYIEQIFIDGDESDSLKHLIFSVIKIPQAHRSSIIKQIEPLIERLEVEEDCYAAADILNLFSAFSELERGTLVSVIDDRFQCLDVNLRYHILGCIELIPPSERTPDVIKMFIDFLEEKEGYAVESIGSCLEKIQRDQRVSAIKKIALFPLNEGEDFPEGLFLLASSMSQDQIEDIISQMAECVTALGKDRIPVEWYPILANISQDQRLSFMEKLIFLLKSSPSVISSENLLPGLFACTVVPPGDVRDAAFEILLSKKKIQIDKETKLTIQEAYLFAKHFIREVDDKIPEVVQIFAQVPESQRAKLILQANSVFKGMKIVEYKLEILQSLNEIPEDQRDSLILALNQLSSQVAIHEYMIKPLFCILQATPEEIRTDLMQMQDLIAFIKKNAVGKEKFRELFSFIDLIDPKEWLSVIKEANTKEGVFRGSIVSFLFEKRPNVIQETYSYLFNRFELLSLNPKKSRELAEAIVKCQENGSIPQENSLFQKAIEVLCNTDSESMHNPKNPYSLHRELLMNAEPLWMGHLSPYIFENKPIAIHLEGIRSRAQRHFFGKDLDPEIHSRRFLELFDAIQRRLESSEGSALAREIKQIYDCSLEVLQSNIVDGVVIPNLLQVSSNSSGPIPNASFYLNRILKAILQESLDRKAGEILSSREIALLTFAKTTSACSTGQLDGIAIYFNHLPLEFRGAALATTAAQDSLKNYMDAFVQKILNETFSSRSLLDLLRTNAFSGQESHQTLYLKNRLYKQVGFHHQLTFDPHAGMIDDGVFQASLETLMEKFFQVCTPEKLIQGLQCEVNRSLKDSKAGLMVPLDRFFDSLPANKEDLIGLNEEDGSVILIAKGAVALLENFNLIKSCD